MNPPHDLMLVPFTANQPDKARYWMAVLLRPVACPEVPGYCPETMLNGCSFLDTREPKQTQASVKWTGAGKSNSIAHCRENRGSQVPEHVQLSHNLLAE